MGCCVSVLWVSLQQLDWRHVSQYCGRLEWQPLTVIDVWAPQQVEPSLPLRHWVPTTIAATVLGRPHSLWPVEQSSTVTVLSTPLCSLYTVRLEKMLSGSTGWHTTWLPAWPASRLATGSHWLIIQQPAALGRSGQYTQHGGLHSRWTDRLTTLTESSSRRRTGYLWIIGARDAKDT